MKKILGFLMMLLSLQLYAGAVSMDETELMFCSDN